MPTKWYLNMPTRYEDGETKSEAGTRIQLAASPSISVRFATNPQADWTVTYTGSPDAHANYVAAPAFSATTSSLVSGKFRTNLDLPVINGRTYTIEAKRHGGNNARLLRKQYTTTQRIYYTVHYMNNACRDAFNAIERDLQNVFESFGVELKSKGKHQCAKNGTNVNLEYTTTAPGDTLPHTWDATQYPLSRAPNHIRMVVNRDLCDSINGGVEWTMDNTTTTATDRKIRLSSTGTNNRMVVYENDIATLDTTTPFSALTVHTKLAPLTAPLAAISHANEYSHHDSLLVNFEAHTDLRPLVARYSNDGMIKASGTINGRKCAQGWHYHNASTTKATLSSSHTDKAPAVSDDYKLWISGGNKLVIDNPRQFLVSSDFAEKIEVTADSKTYVLDASTATRTNEHRVTIDLSGTSQITDELGSEKNIAVEVTLVGPRARGDDIDDPADFPFELADLHYIGSAVTDRGVTASTTYGTKGFRFKVDKVALTGPAGMTVRFDNYSVPIPVPTTCINATSPHRTEIDLGGDVSLQAIALAMGNGGELTFKGRFKGRESLGGYSPPGSRWFIALNTRALPGWNQTVVRRRLLITICHEIGHALGLAVQQVRNRSSSSWEQNDRWYTNEYGGQGPHCHHNAHLVNAGAANGYPDTTSGQYYVHDGGTGKLCIMYHAIDHDNIGDNFCDRCLVHLHRAVANFGEP